MEKEELKLEDAMEQLEKIASELEENNIDLDAAVLKFEKGMEISKKCAQILENAERKITILIKDGNEYKEENFEN